MNGKTATKLKNIASDLPAIEARGDVYVNHYEKLKEVYSAKGQAGVEKYVQEMKKLAIERARDRINGRDNKIREHDTKIQNRLVV